MEQNYVGLDVGLEETSLCIVDSEGKTVRETKVSTEPEAIRSALEGYADRLSRIGVEASSLGLWLYRELHEGGLPIIVVEARHMGVSLSTMRYKTDRNDARGIAQMMRLGWFRAVHVKNVEMQKMRTLLPAASFSSASWWTSRTTFAVRCEPTDCWSEPSVAGNMRRACAS
jgi:transposase